MGSALSLALVVLGSHLLCLRAGTDAASTRDAISMHLDRRYPSLLELYKHLHAPGLHSSLFAPDPEPTLKTGITAMSVAVLELMGKK